MSKSTSTSELEEYLADNYGVCTMPPPPKPHKACLCRDPERQISLGIYPGWKGRQCPHWRPLGVRSWTDLRQHMIDTYGNKD